MIKKLEVSRYSLKPRATRAAARSGALLRVTFAEFETPGISDLFPWSEFGDPSLDTWFEELRRSLAGSVVEHDLSPTLRRAIEAAHDDAVAISKREPLVRGSVVNHWLATDPMDLAVHDVMEARRAMSPAIKIKIGKHAPLDEARALGRLQSHWGLRLRLDANERLTREALLTFLDALPIRIRESIEFIEDPFPFDLRAWSEFHRETGFDVAYDRGARDRALGDSSSHSPSLQEIFSSGASQVLIHKPAWQDDARAVFARERGMNVVVTSILGHPIGNLWAASKAWELAPAGVHGCKSHVAYREDEASLTLVKSKQVRGSRIVGTGIGLGLQSKWMDRLRWESLT